MQKSECRGRGEGGLTPAWGIILRSYLPGGEGGYLLCDKLACTFSRPFYSISVCVCACAHLLDGGGG